jgi:transcriptional regulator with XRE-family HTH domain
VTFQDERDIAEAALSDLSAGTAGRPFPPAAQRFRDARERRGLTEAEVAAQWGQPPSMYWHLESDDAEAFAGLCLGDVVRIAKVLDTSVSVLLFGADPPSSMPNVTCDGIAVLLRARLLAEQTTAEALGEAIGWDIAAILETPLSFVEQSL